MEVKVAVAVKSAVIHCVMSLVLRMQDAYGAFIWEYYSSLLLFVVDAVGWLYHLPLSAAQIKAFMINAVTAAQDVAVVKNFVKNTIHVVMRINFQ